MDAGPMFATASIPIPPDATSGEMQGPLSQLGAELLLPVVDDLATGRAVETPQDASRATHAAKITKEEGAIDWSATATAVHNKVRGLQPWPLASTHLAGHRYVLRRTAPLPGAPGAIPGTVVRAEGDELIVACGGDTALRLIEIQPEGRRTMTAREFLAGRGVAEGARFEP